MSNLVSNINPEGKQKVYFCCHPDDLDKYYDAISRDIIAANDNSAIFHETEPFSAYDEQTLFAMLDKMNLFVIPVTASFLAGDSRACSVDLAYAVKNHIPVLPVAVEPGITDSFNESALLGGLQYIDRTSTDSTEISYSEKLKRYLDSVLVSDKLAKRIREEFAASMFLSYRKKDRASAQELMARIRTIDFCRDVAIWYDEYLIPGESFEDNIRESLVESDVVLMNVTPSLLEKGNYIAEEEYPAAEKLSCRDCSEDSEKQGKHITAASVAAGSWRLSTGDSLNTSASYRYTACSVRWPRHAATDTQLRNMQKGSWTPAGGSRKISER